LSLRQSAEIAQEARELAQAFADLERPGDDALPAYLDFASACLEIRRVRQIQAKLMSDDNALHDARILRQLMMTERYERRALTQRRRAAEKFSN
jgi:hypothetical protein